MSAVKQQKRVMWNTVT